jgi:hypothetical protein
MATAECFQNPYASIQKGKTCSSVVCMLPSNQEEDQKMGFVEDVSALLHTFAKIFSLYNSTT